MSWEEEEDEYKKKKKKYIYQEVLYSYYMNTLPQDFCEVVH